MENEFRWIIYFPTLFAFYMYKYDFFYGIALEA